MIRLIFIIPRWVSPSVMAECMTYGAYAYHPYWLLWRSELTIFVQFIYRNLCPERYCLWSLWIRSVGQSYNPYTGTMATRSGSVSTPYGTRSAGQAYNPYTGASAATRQGSGAYGQAGTSVYNNGHGTATQTAHATNNYGQTVAGARNTNGAKAVAGSGPNGSGGVAKAGKGICMREKTETYIKIPAADGINRMETGAGQMLPPKNNSVCNIRNGQCAESEIQNASQQPAAGKRQCKPVGWRWRS